MPAFDIGSMCREFLCRCRLGDGEFRIWVAERLTAIYSADTSRLFFSDWFRGGSSESSAPAVCVRREKAALSCGLKPHPAKAPVGINRRGHGGRQPVFRGNVLQLYRRRFKTLSGVSATTARALTALT